MSTLIENVNRIYTDKEAIKQAVVAKGVTVPDGTSLDEYAELIAQINCGVDTGDATANAAQILNGSTAYVKGSKITGTMANRGTVNHSLPINGSYTIPAGYHNGSGKVTQNITSKAAEIFVPTTTDKTIAANQYLSGIQTIKGDTNLIPANIVSGKSIFGVNGSANSGDNSIFTTTLVCQLFLNQAGTNISGGNTYTFDAENAKRITFYNIVFSQLYGSFGATDCKYRFVYDDGSKDNAWTIFYTYSIKPNTTTIEIAENVSKIELYVEMYGGLSDKNGFLRTTIDVKIEN